MVRVVPNTATMSVLYFCGYCGAVTAQGVWVAASTVGATMPRMLRPRPAADRQPVLLQGAGRHAGRRIAAEQDEPAAALEQRVDAVAGQRHDLVGGPVAVGDVPVVAEIDEGQLRKALHQCANYRQARRGRNRRRRSCLQMPCRRRRRNRQPRRLSVGRRQRPALPSAPPGSAWRRCCSRSRRSAPRRSRAPDRSDSR